MIKIKKRFTGVSYFSADASKMGWVLCTVQDKVIYFSFSSKLSAELVKDKQVFIDIPVSLPVCIFDYPRVVDRSAKSILGKFHSSLFYAPLVSWLDLSYQSINNQCFISGKPKLSMQSYYLFKRIKEIYILHNALSNCFQEVHPELLFYFFLKNRKLSKKSKEGVIQRIMLINELFNYKFTFDIFFQLKLDFEMVFSKKYIAYDDILDSLFIALIYEFLTTLHNYKNCDNFNKNELFAKFNFFK